MSTTFALMPSVPTKSFDDFAIDNVEGTSYALLANACLVTWQTSFGTAPDAINIIIETSLDDSVWSTVATTTAVGGETGSFVTSALFIRASIVSHTNGDTVTVNLVAKTAMLSAGQTLIGNITEGQIAFGSATANTLEGDGNFIWNKTTGQIFISGAGSAGSVYAFSEAPDGANTSIGAIIEGTSDGSLVAGLVGLIVRTFTGDSGGSTVPFQRSIQINQPLTDGGIVDEITGLYVRDITGGNISSYAIKTSAGLVSFGDDLQLATGKAFKTDTTTAHTVLIQAYDVDGAAYKTFVTLTNGNTPDMTVAPPAGSTLVLQATTYKSSDGSSGATGSANNTNTLTIKNGLVTNIA